MIHIPWFGLIYVEVLLKGVLPKRVKRWEIFSKLSLQLLLVFFYLLETWYGMQKFINNFNVAISSENLKNNDSYNLLNLLLIFFQRFSLFKNYLSFNFMDSLPFLTSAHISLDYLTYYQRAILGKPYSHRTKR